MALQTELDKVIATAFGSEGKQEDVSKVYLTLLRETLLMPVEKIAAQDVPQSEGGLEEDEPFKPLFAKFDDKYFMLVFDTIERLTAWAGDQFELIDYVEISGRDLVAGINETVFLCLNVGTEFYKEFSPEEILQLKKVVARIDQLKS
jgi:hypothetical protein